MTLNKQHRRTQITIGQAHHDALVAFASSNDITVTRAVECLIQEHSEARMHKGLQKFLEKEKKYEQLEKEYG